MKRLVILLLTGVMLSLCACSGTDSTAATMPETTIMTTAAEMAEPEVDVQGEWVSIQDNTQKLILQKDGSYMTEGEWMDPDFGQIHVEGVYVEGANDKKQTYSFEPAAHVLTLHDAERSMKLIQDNHNFVIAEFSGEILFVRPEVYETYHEQYQTQMQKVYDDFYAEGKQGREEMIFGEKYILREGLAMTAQDVFTHEYTDSVQGLPGTKLCMKVLFENFGEEKLFLRQDGVRIDGVYHLKWHSDIPAEIKVVRYGEPAIQNIFISGGDGQGGTTTANYVYTQEELDQSTDHINNGNHICLQPGETGEYYLVLNRSTYGNMSQNAPAAYATLTFEQCDLFCDLTAAMK